MRKRLKRFYYGLLARVPKRKRKLLAAGLVVAALFVVFIFWFQRPVVAEVTYNTCDISYGEVVGEWSGRGDTDWDDARMHYQARSFSLIAHAPGVVFPNTIEATPTRLSTGGDEACLEDFNESIDTTSSAYRYNGARASAVRLGVPSQADRAGFMQVHPSTPRVNDSPNLSTPVYGGPVAEAAAWVDDGGSAYIWREGEPNLAWCINGQECNDITGQAREGLPMRGSGYQFVIDNCPDSLDCQDEWYRQDVFESLSTAGNGFVAPFNLRLSAVSTWAPYIGARTLLVFAYPTTPSFDIGVTDRQLEVDPGEEFEFELDIMKYGPSIENAQLRLDVTDQPLAETNSPITLSEEQLDRLNREDRLRLKMTLSLLREVERGACYEMGIHLQAEAETETTTESTGLNYCVSQPRPVSPVSRSSYTYTVSTRGNVTSDFSQFRTQVSQTLNDSRGWVGAGVSFQEVSSGGDFTLWLAAPDQMTSFATGCSPYYSCRVGANVIVNDERWQQATEPWNEAGGSIRDYRHMVVNHEVGHLLGLGHYDCPQEGSLAPVMQQQSIDLQGCKFNPWPLPFELAAV